MPTVTTRQLLVDAQARKLGVVAFNVITLEHAEAIVGGAEAAGCPVILQISENTVRFHSGRLAPLAAAAAAVAAAADVPVSLHLDHVTDPALLHEAPAAGLSSVMFDASTLAYDGNVEATRAAADWAHEHALHVEAELGEVGGKDGAHAPGARTDPAQAGAYVAATGVDSLAVAVGSSHAMTTRTARLDQRLIAALRDAVPVPLVLHGSSGVAEDDLRDAVRSGIVKVNVGTILNVAFTAGIRETLQEPGVVDPRTYLGPARERMSAAVRRLLSVISDGT